MIVPNVSNVSARSSSNSAELSQCLSQLKAPLWHLCEALMASAFLVLK